MKRVHESGAQKRAKRKRRDQAARIGARTLFQCGIRKSEIVEMHSEILKDSTADITPAGTEEGNKITSEVATSPTPAPEDSVVSVKLPTTQTTTAPRHSYNLRIDTGLIFAVICCQYSVF